MSTLHSWQGLGRAAREHSGVLRWLPAVPGVPLSPDEDGPPGRPWQVDDPPEDRELAADGIRLWLLPEAAVPAFAERLGGVGVLSAAERARMARLRTSGARRRYFGARLLSRFALSEAAPVPPADWSFTTGRYGRPEPVRPPGGLRFNLSHTRGMLACVVSRGRACGVDIERAAAPSETLQALQARFAPAERAALAALRPGPRATQVMAYWVLKEAYLKALGTGLLRAPDSFVLSAPHEPPVRVYDPPGTLRPQWHLSLLHPGPEHVLAVATDGAAPGPLRLTRISG
ncbi:4'-phosphopantetheinyl transferase superfamily protein [Streptomyces bohaiensis]|uniref:4'-phosphopantetheinyl transferase superfamily protein n=1 Tax=Streptomyces bohaiensis TaxID=1431344 RepID=A0ABX1C8L1_9ACTN|nr:4'-phosphopantetheinyl transferase superfamily protein [Streptomyces bohaiensis]NJQ14285.1 4'-phosphopantetheinyl transferase superfamily protein [Streptomyces bohaiensis]